MKLQDLLFSDSFFENEVRDGFFIPSMMKRNWACQLEVLKVIDSVCEANHIPWFIDAGTLLGAVRHQGFIPWDDDIDIIMTRANQRRFIEAAEGHLPAGYILRNPEKESDAKAANLMLFNSDIIDSSSHTLNKFHGFPYGVCVDIFTLDGVPDDENDEEKRHECIDRIRDAITMIKSGKEQSHEFRRLIQMIDIENHTQLMSSKYLEGDLWRLMIKYHTMYSDHETKRLEYIWRKEDRYIYEAEWFEETVFLTFEGIELPAPKGYEHVLRVMFGDYLIAQRVQASHGYPTYGKQEKKLEREIHCHPFRYTMTVENVVSSVKESPVKQMQKMFDLAEKIVSEIIVSRQDIEVAQKLLLALQKLLMKMIEILSDIFSDDAPGIRRVNELTKYVFEIFSNPMPESCDNLMREVTETMNAIKADCRGNGDILFICLRDCWWPQIEDILKQVINKRTDAERRLRCIKIPLYSKTATGERGGCINRDDLISDDVMICKMDEYDISACRPSKIIIQFPFDGTDTALTIDEEYFSYNLKKYTEQLIYIPCFDPDSPESDDMIAKTTLSILVEQPATAFSDLIVVKDEKMKMFYIETLEKLTGSDLNHIWKQKLITKEELITRLV